MDLCLNTLFLFQPWCHHEVQVDDDAFMLGPPNVNALHAEANVDRESEGSTISGVSESEISAEDGEDEESEDKITGTIRDPNPIEDFLADYIAEVQILQADGILLDRHFPVQLRLYVADSLARAYLKGIMGNTPLHGCERCPQVGPHYGHVCYATEISEPSRTEDSFLALLSPLTALQTGSISQFPGFVVYNVQVALHLHDDVHIGMGGCLYFQLICLKTCLDG
ncbi:hypothetical protein FOCC_FOCC002542 [Frankliniella occidentalis]|nr:hypothetical protein FOCC_FOCC002542 [Frankliniella occidentalis]